MRLGKMNVQLRGQRCADSRHPLGLFPAGAIRRLEDQRRILRGILLGLEFLVAADIIRTVAVSPTIENALALGLIVLIRTFLSMSIEVELEGRWPWKRAVTRESP